MSKHFTDHEKYKINKKITIIGVFANSFLAIIKMFFGLIGFSPALFADGLHSLSDVLSDVMVLVAVNFSHKEPDEEHPYGHYRFETMATMLLSIILLIVGVLIAYDSIKNLILGAERAPEFFTIFAAIISIIVNEFLFFYTLKAGNLTKSPLLIANAWHNRGDSLSSIVVLIGIIGSLLGYSFMEAIAAILVCVLIIKIGIKWFISSANELIDTSTDKETVKKIKNELLKIREIKSFHNVRTREMAGNVFLDIHILVDEKLTASEGHYIGEVTRAKLGKKFDNIRDITIHIDVHNHKEKIPKLNELPPSRYEIINIINEIFNKNSIKYKEIDLFYNNDKKIIETILNLDEEFINKKNTLQKVKKDIENKLNILHIKYKIILD